MRDQLTFLFMTLRDFVEPLRRRFERADALELLVRRYGWLAPLDAATFETVGRVAPFRAPLTELVTIAAGIEDRLAQDPDASLDPASIEQLATTAAALLRAVATFTPASLAGLAEPFGRADFWASVGEHVLEDLVDEYVRAYRPGLHAFLRLWGVIRHEPSEPTGPFRTRYTRVALDWDQLLAAVRDPMAALRAAYDWGDPVQPFAHARAFEALVSVLRALRVPATLFPPALDLAPALELAPGHRIEAAASALRVVLVPAIAGLDHTLYRVGGDLLPATRAGEARVSGLVIKAILDGAAGATLPLGDAWRLRWSVTASAGDAIGASLFPGEARFVGGSAAVGARLELTRPGAEPWLVIGTPRTSRLEVAGAAVSVALEGSAADPEVVVRVGADRLAATLLPPDDDPTGLLGREPRRFGAPVALRWSSKTGLAVPTGGVTLDLASGRRVGIVALDALRISAVATDDGGVRLAATASGAVTLGPIVATVADVGVACALTPRGDRRLRELAVSIGFQPPSAVGLRVDGGPVEGGGFLRLDDARGEYAGALELAVAGVAMSAFGVLTTHLPGDRRGFSLAAVVSAQFSPVQIGLGFTLQGVGGLIGIHRRVDVDALRAALRGPGVGDIFFPADPVAQAARLTGDLARYFPAAAGRHVVGPAVKLGWGTPTLVTAELALLVELPAPVRMVLIGTAAVALPTQDRRVIDLKVDVVGELDLGQKRVAIDASLRDSKIAGFPIVGDLALRTSWGASPSFALAIGGFHSQFRRPPGFPDLRRIQIAIGSGDNPRLDLQGFLALTSNTAQIGAQIQLYAAAGPLNIKGDLGFETLLTFSPLRLQVDLWAGVKLRRGTTVLAGVHFEGRLTGPGPWKLDGEASLSLWFVDLRVPVHVRFGRDEAVELPRRRIWDVLGPEVGRAANWSTALAPGIVAVTTAPPVDATATPRVDPGATITLRQTVVPLDRPITRFGQVRPEGPNDFRVTDVKVAGRNVLMKPVRDWFAPAQFEDLSEADRLSRPGFEQMISGVTVTSDAMRAGAPLIATLEYETKVWADGRAQTAAPPFRPSRAEQVMGTALSSAALASLRSTGVAAYAPPPAFMPRFTLTEETFVIASTVDLRARLDLCPATTRSLAELGLRTHLTYTPADAGTLQVVSSVEAVA